MDAVTCLTWIKRGVAKANPDKVQLNDDELSKLIKSAGKTQADDDDEQSDKEENSAGVDNGNVDEMDTVEARYNLDLYDDDGVDDDVDNGVLSMAGLSFYDSNQQDPYLNKDGGDSDEDSDDRIHPDDNLIALGKVHGDYFSLEIWVNNSSDGSLYCHHDVVLPNCPLAIEWVGFDSGDDDPLSGNLVAIGSMSRDIELWDVDVVNSLEPAFVLKGERKKKSKNASGSKKLKRSPGHSDAVLGLSWNRKRPSVLASASADESVGVWDLTTGTVVSFFRSHKDKVQTVQWHPVEDQLLLSGSYDGCVRLFDCRAPPGDPKRSWSLGGEIEKVLWNFHNPFSAFAGTDGGLLACIDVRQTDPLYTFSAHTSALTSLVLSPSIVNCLTTASNDRSLKVWDISNATDSLVPVLVTERLCKIGAIHCAASCPEEQLVVCIGGEREMKVLNLQKDSRFVGHFLEKIDVHAEAGDVAASPLKDSRVSNGVAVQSGGSQVPISAAPGKNRKKKGKGSKSKKQ